MTYSHARFNGDEEAASRLFVIVFRCHRGHRPQEVKRFTGKNRGYAVDESPLTGRVRGDWVVMGM